MRSFSFSAGLIAIASALLITPAALAKGQVNVEQADGTTESHIDVEFINTDEALYLKPEEGVDLAIITKEQCQIENQLQFCSVGDLKLRTYGVDETIEIEKMVLFTNTTTERQTIQGSQMSLAPNTVVLEILTSEGTYITGIGKIDATELSEE